MEYYWHVGIAIIIGAILINHFYFRKYIKEMRALALLLQQGDTEKYVEEVEKLVQRVKNKHLKNTFRLNLTAGYYDLKQFKKALEILESLSKERLKGLVKDIHALNLCACYFYDEQPERAMEVYARSRKQFNKLSNTKAYAGNIIVIDMFALIHIGKIAEAENALHEARKSYDNPRLQDDFAYLETKIEEEKAKGESEEAQ